ncbi:MAG: polyphosphate kinase 1 [Gammaproteobacteria bacterium]|nr:polyphosphate kinase 1 [Gammaproteobacteria bacterium]
MDKTSTTQETVSPTQNGEEKNPFADLNAPECYLNREITWLEFNRRVLNEAIDTRTPLLERLKFIAIVSSNLDEFFMKRIGGLKEQLGAGVQELTVDGRSPKQQIEECYEIVRDIETQHEQTFEDVLQGLQQHGVHFLNYQDLNNDEQQTLRAHYLNNIFPLVTPQSVDPAHPFPFISNLSLNLLVTLRHPNETRPSLARIKVPVGAGVPRFLQVANQHRYIRLEDVMLNNLDLLFPGMEIDACEAFFVTRNANTERDEANADDLLALIEAELRTRKFAPIVRITVQQGMDPVRCGRLATELGLDAESDVFERRGMLAKRDLFELVSLEIPELRYPTHHSVEDPRLAHATNIFYSLREAGAILLHHPYETFTSSVERFLREASRDPKVRAIKMTIYRTSSDTKIIEYLIAAALNGKQVAVAVELKARFDEAANIRWANRLEEAGIHVTYGVMGLKTHCKVILVVRQDYNGLRRYAHVGTGNYHAGTAKIYTDLGLLTCDKTIGEDLTELFNYLTTGYVPKRQYRKILPAPARIKKALIDKIQREIRNQVNGDSGLIQFKMNALEDIDIARELYKASQAGVKVDLIVRDTCRLRPGIKGLSENIRVISIVGRFLEHSRIYYFRNAGKEEYYIGSADMMTRNLKGRVEVLVPIEPEELQAELRQILDINLGDERAAWEMQSDGTYKQRTSRKKNPLSCQEQLMELAKKREKEARAAMKLKPQRPAVRSAQKESQ